MKVALTIPSFQGGGAERVAVDVANHLSSAGHQVSLIVLSHEGPYADELSKDVEVIALERSRALFAIWDYILYFRTKRPEVLLSFLTHLNLIVLVAHLLARSRCKLYVSERNSLQTNQSSLTEYIQRRLSRRLYRRSAKVIAVSEALRVQLISKLALKGEHVVAIPNPVNILDIQNKSLERVSHEWLRDGRDHLTIVAVGRLTPQKDYHLMLRSFASVRVSRDVRLVILGEGPLLQDLIAYAGDLGIANSVDFVGFKQNPFGWIRSADLYLLTSAWEGMPNVLLQALAVGTPAIAIDCPTGPSEIISTKDPHASIVRSRNHEVIGVEIDRVLGIPKHVRVPSSDVEKFSSSRILSIYEDVLVGSKDD